MSSSKDKNKSSGHKQEDKPLTIQEFERNAQNKLTKQVWDFYVSGSEEQMSVKRNRYAYDKYGA